MGYATHDEVQGPYIVLYEGKRYVLAAYAAGVPEAKQVESRAEMRADPAPEATLTWYFWSGEGHEITEIDQQRADELQQDFSYDPGNWPKGFDPDRFTQYIWDRHNT